MCAGLTLGSARSIFHKLDRFITSKNCVRIFLIIIGRTMISIGIPIFRFFAGYHRWLSLHNPFVFEVCIGFIVAKMVSKTSINNKEFAFVLYWY